MGNHPLVQKVARSFMGRKAGISYARGSYIMGPFMGRWCLSRVSRLIHFVFCDLPQTGDL